MKKILSVFMIAVLLFILTSCVYDCKTCEDSKKIDCNVCDAKGYYTCYECDGSGEKDCTLCTNGQRSHVSSLGLEYRICLSCTGKGTVSCSKTKDCMSCSSGKVDCPDCN